MDYPKIASEVLVLVFALMCAGARAGQQEPAGPCPAHAAATDPAAGPAPPPERKPTRRRSARQEIVPTPPIVTEQGRPPPALRPPSAPPVRINSCDGGGCTDTNGVRYSGGVGNTLIGPRGQLCTRGSVNLQCF